MTPVNPYEAACDRFNRASVNYPKAKAEAERIVREAEEEREAAQANLARYEQSPGIPLPQWRDLNYCAALRVISNAMPGGMP